MASMSDNLSPYAGGETSDGDKSSRSTQRTEAIPARDQGKPVSWSQNPRTGSHGGEPRIRDDIEGYAPKGAGTSASREDSQLVGSRNTARGVRDGVVETVTAKASPFRGDGRDCPYPAEPTPYANESRTSATRRDAEGE